VKGQSCPAQSRPGTPRDAVARDVAASRGRRGGGGGGAVPRRRRRGGARRAPRGHARMLPVVRAPAPAPPGRAAAGVPVADDVGEGGQGVRAGPCGVARQRGGEGRGGGVGRACRGEEGCGSGGGGGGSDSAAGEGKGEGEGRSCWSWRHEHDQASLGWSRCCHGLEV